MVMAAELLCLSKTLSLVSFPFPKSTLPLLLRATPYSLPLHRRRRFLSRLSAADHLDVSATEPDGDESDVDFDLAALEEEAIVTVEEFSSSLSKLLTIGILVEFHRSIRYFK